jgi:hypothetical protein
MTEESRDTRANGELTTVGLAGGVERRDQPDQPNDMGREDEQPAANRPRPTSTEPGAVLFSTEKASTLKSRWQEIQVGFVDEPRQALERADKLIAEVIQQLVRTAVVCWSRERNLEAPVKRAEWSG